MILQAEATATSGESQLTGLSSAEAVRRRAEFGPNAVVEEHVHPLVRVARHFWAPVPWMLEATIVLQIAIGQRLTGGLVAALLILNVALGVFQESRASAALALLRRQLALQSRVKRDGVWMNFRRPILFPAISCRFRSAASCQPTSPARGSLLVDQSMLTGESMPVEVESGKTTLCGRARPPRRGDAEVMATGTRTYFGRTAELVSIAHVESAEQKAVLAVVRNLTIVNFAMVVGIVVYAHVRRHQPAGNHPCSC